MWIIFAFLSSIFAALVTIFGKLGLSNIDTTLATTVRAVIMAIILVLCALVFGKFANFSLNSFSGREWIFISLAGFAGAMSWLFYFLALRSGDATAVSAIDKLSTVIIIVLAVIFLSEKLTLQIVIGGVLATVGALLIAWK